MMTHRPRDSAWRHAGLAFGLLAIWVLSLLGPMHQTAGLLRDLQARGFDISGAWSICQTLDHDGSGHDGIAQSCPALGVGKTAIALPALPVADAAPVALARVILPQVAALPAAAGFTRWDAIPRAPPAA